MEEYRTEPGKNYVDGSNTAAFLANLKQKTIIWIHNGIRIPVNPGDTGTEVGLKWEEESGSRRDFERH